MNGLDEMLYAPAPLKIEYVKALSELLEWCNILNVEIESVHAYMYGFRVTFKGVDGDAICHENSYGHPEYWESYKMPWDEDDVSTNTAQELVRKIAAMLSGRDWRSV